MTMTDPRQEREPFVPSGPQREAIEDLDGPRFIAAGAGSGKTGVVTRRFVHAIAAGKAGVDEILTITFTIKAAAEMMERIRDLLRRRELTGIEPDEEQRERMARAYRDIERARISTIDSFCSSLLRENALMAGVDPAFAVADQSQALIMREEAFDICLERFIREQEEAGRGRQAVDLVSAYDDRLRGDLFRQVGQIYDVFRSRGQEPSLPAAPVDAEGCEADLCRAVREIRDGLRREGKEGKTADALLEAADAVSAALEQADARDRLEALAGVGPKRNKVGNLKLEIDAFADAYQAYAAELRSVLARDTLDMFARLLSAFHQEYSALKERRGVLDFADLALGARDLLRDRATRDRVAGRYKLIMVDEFQDTNHLQYEIVHLLSGGGGNLCLVGDENQSIYGFRDAEVELFRREREKARSGGYLTSLTGNYRSHGDILAFVDSIFNRRDMLGDGYLKLEPRAEPDGRADDRRVEVIFVDQGRTCKAEGLKSAVTDVTRPAEAQLIAERLNQLYGEGGYTAADTAVLLTTRKDADKYRDALEKNGIASYLAIDISYYSKLEFSDVLNLLRLLVNPLDDLALIAVLRSPMVAVSDDTIYHLRLARDEGGGASGMPLWPLLEDPEAITGLDEGEAARLAAFHEACVRLRGDARSQSLSATVRAAIRFNGFDIAVATLGKQRLANLLKLIDLAVDFESVWGSSLAEFTSFLEHQKLKKIKESEAPVEEEGVDAVRIMTVHSAKGLEFPLVVLPKLEARKGSGRDGPPVLLVDRPEEPGAPPSRVGLRYKATGDGGSLAGKAFEYEQLEEEAKAREAEELRRLIYVAMTRAKSHLILCGTGNAEKYSEADNPFNWIRGAYSLARKDRPDLDSLASVEGPGGLEVGLSLCTDPQSAVARLAEAEAGITGGGDMELSSDLGVMPGPAVFVPSHVSPTALDDFRSCPRRYYLGNVLRVGGFRRRGTGRAAAAGLDSSGMGTLVHAVLERAAFPTPDVLDVDDSYLGALANAELDEPPAVTAGDVERARQLLAAFSRLDTGREVVAAAAEGRLLRERDFAIMVGRTIVAGKIDALVLGDAETVVVDYKTGVASDGDEDDLLEGSYGYQLAAYALAAGRMRPQPVRVVLMFLGGGGAERVSRFETDQLADLELRLAAAIDDMQASTFPPLDGFDSGQCPFCAAGPQGAGICMTRRQ